MTEALYIRLDKFVTSLLDAAESGCDNPAANDTSATEERPGPRPVSLSERVQVLKACTAYLELRDKRGGAGKPKDEEPGEPPEIDGFVTRLRKRR